MAPAKDPDAAPDATGNCKRYNELHLSIYHGADPSAAARSRLQRQWGKPMGQARNGDRAKRPDDAPVANKSFAALVLQSVTMPVDAAGSGPVAAPCVRRRRGERLDRRRMIRALIRDHVSIARPGHWLKNVFMLPGVLLGWLALHGDNSVAAMSWPVAARVLGAVLSTCLVCSANYSFNEVLDAPTDRHHPGKRRRPIAAGRVGAPPAYAQWLALAAAGLATAWWIGRSFFWTQAALFAMGVVYNLRPLRLKERPYADVLSESVNNPLRLLLGWYAVRCPLIPPASLLISYWMLGAFFMAVKRLSELRYIRNPRVAAAYRASFRWYTQERLLISIVFYATAFALFAGIFLVRYRVELILAAPFVAGFMGLYMRIGFLPHSPAQRPERLYRQKHLVVYGLLTCVVLVACCITRMPWLEHLVRSTVPKGF